MSDTPTPGPDRDVDDGIPRAGSADATDPDGRDSPSGLRRAVGNVTSLLTSNVINRATSFVVYAIVGRYIGASELGQLALAVTFLFLFSRLSLVGLQPHIAREIAGDRATSGRYVANGLIIVFVTSVIGSALAFLVVELLGYQPSTSRVILIMMLGLVPFSIAQLLEAVLLAWHKASHVAAINSPIHIVQTVIVFVLVQRGYSVEAVALSIVVAYAAMALLLTITVLHIAGRSSLELDGSLARNMAKTGLTFLGIQLANTLNASIEIIFVSKFLGEIETGIFAAARQLNVPLNLVSQSVGFGLFPTMVQSYRAGIARLQRIIGQVTELMMAVVLPAAAGVAVLAGPLLTLIYGGDTFDDSVTVSRILVWVTVLYAFTAVLGHALNAVGRERVTLRIAAYNVALKAIFAAALIPMLGVSGAAVAAVSVGAINVVQYYFPVVRIVGKFAVVAVLWRPVVGVVVMVVVLLFSAGLPVAAQILLAMAVYGATFALLLAVSGRWKELRLQSG